MVGASFHPTLKSAGFQDALSIKEIPKSPKLKENLALFQRDFRDFLKEFGKLYQDLMRESALHKVLNGAPSSLRKKKKSLFLGSKKG